jgi:hypothetical protein
VEKRLAGRLEIALDAWNKCLLGKKEDHVDYSMDTDTPQSASMKLGGEPNIKVN